MNNADHAAELPFQPLGSNVAVYQNADFIYLRIDKRAPTAPSASGKTLVLASTRGNQPVGDVYIGLNAYRYPAKRRDALEGF